MTDYKSIFDNLRQDYSPSNLNDKVLVFDGLNLFIRIFTAVPSINDDGEHIGGVTGFLRSMTKVIREQKPTRVVVVFDGKGGSQRRKKLFPDYKANRAVRQSFNRHEEFATLEDEQESMRRQMGRLIQYLKVLPVDIMGIDNIEADDAIAYITTDIFPTSNITIVSTDRDFLQLVDDRVSVWSPVKKKMYTPERMLEEFGIPAQNYLYYRVLTGDKSDNIPGVRGVGLKTATKFLPMLSEEREFPISEIADYSDERVEEKKFFKNISESRDILELNHELMQLKDVNISGHAKSKIREILAIPPGKMNTFEFKRMFMEDKMYTTILNLDSWLRSAFATLDSFAKQ